MAVALTVLGIFALLVGCEVLWRRQGLQGEFSRKFIHITVGSFVAFWPYFLSPLEIKLLSLSFIVVIGVSRYLHIFSAIHSVQRPTWGEVWFALVVGLLAFDLKHAHVYTAALLEMSLADGLAAVIGSHFGQRNRYRVLGSTKSLIGTLTFFATSLFILAGYNLLTPGTGVGAWIVPIAVGTAILENVGIRGFDNLLVPIFTAAVLHAFI